MMNLQKLFIAKLNTEVTIREYFTKEKSPSLGLAVVEIDGHYPGQRKWALNNKVDEMYYVIEGKGSIEFEGSGKFTLDFI